MNIPVEHKQNLTPGPLYDPSVTLGAENQKANALARATDSLTRGIDHVSRFAYGVGMDQKKKAIKSEVFHAQVLHYELTQEKLRELEQKPIYQQGEYEKAFAAKMDDVDRKMKDYTAARFTWQESFDDYELYRVGSRAKNMAQAMGTFVRKSGELRTKEFFHDLGKLVDAGNVQGSLDLIENYEALPPQEKKILSEQAVARIETNNLNKQIAFGESIANPENAEEYNRNLLNKVFSGEAPAGSESNKWAAIVNLEKKVQGLGQALDSKQINNAIHYYIDDANREQLEFWRGQSEKLIRMSFLPVVQKEDYLIQLKYKYEKTLHKLNKSAADGLKQQHVMLLEDGLRNEGYLSLEALDPKIADTILKSRDIWRNQGRNALNNLDTSEYNRVNNELIRLMQDVDAYKQSGDEYGTNLKKLLVRSQFFDTETSMIVLEALNQKIKGYTPNELWDAQSKAQFDRDMDDLIKWSDADELGSDKDRDNATEYYRFRNSFYNYVKTLKLSPAKAKDELVRNPYYKKFIEYRTVKEARKLFNEEVDVKHIFNN